MAPSTFLLRCIAIKAWISGIAGLAVNLCQPQSRGPSPSEGTLRNGILDGQSLPDVYANIAWDSFALRVPMFSNCKKQIFLGLGFPSWVTSAVVPTRCDPLFGLRIFVLSGLVGVTRAFNSMKTRSVYFSTFWWHGLSGWPAIYPSSLATLGCLVNFIWRFLDLAWAFSSRQPSTLCHSGVEAEARWWRDIHVTYSGLDSLGNKGDDELAWMR